MQATEVSAEIDGEGWSGTDAFTSQGGIRAQYDSFPPAMQTTVRFITPPAMNAAG